MAEEDMGFSPADRTLLVRIQVEVEHLVQDMKSNVSKLQKLEDDHVSREEIKKISDDHVSREEFEAVSETVDNLERWRWRVLGGASVIGALAAFTAKALFH